MLATLALRKNPASPEACPELGRRACPEHNRRGEGFQSFPMGTITASYLATLNAPELSPVFRQ